MERNPLTSSLAFMIAFGVTSTGAAVEPAPTPTPKAGSLAALAAGRQLQRGTAAHNESPIVITDHNLGRFADDAVVTLMTSTAADAAPVEPVAAVDPKLRQRWRTLVLRQRVVIAKLESKRRAVETEIDRLGRGRLDSKTLDRIEKAEAKLELVDAELARENTELSRMVRDARKQGAQPGWFR
jgi:hypothetical protein